MTLTNSSSANDSNESLAIFSIGSNCGDRLNNVREGLNWLSQYLYGFKSSSIYPTPDCQGGVKIYFNAVACGTTQLSAALLIQMCKQYELSHGRDQEKRLSGDVPIDIDLVVFNDSVLRPNDFKREFFKIGYSMI